MVLFCQHFFWVFPKNMKRKLNGNENSRCQNRSKTTARLLWLAGPASHSPSPYNAAWFDSGVAVRSAALISGGLAPPINAVLAGLVDPAGQRGVRGAGRQLKATYCQLFSSLFIPIFLYAYYSPRKVFLIFAIGIISIKIFILLTYISAPKDKLFSRLPLSAHWSYAIASSYLSKSSSASLQATQCYSLIRQFIQI